MSNISHTAGLIALLTLFSSVLAETGMCLVVTSTARIDATNGGSIRRIDLKDDKVIRTSPSLGTGKYPRFSPDGTEFAYITGTTVKICALDGIVNTQFSVTEHGTLSYSKNGIYIADASKIRLYDRRGIETWSITPKSYSGANVYVSQNGRFGTGVTKLTGNDGKKTWRTVVYDLKNNVTRHVATEQGCSACPSPDGTMFTQNRGDGDWKTFNSSCHLFMRIRKTNVTLDTVHNLDLMSLTGYSDTESPRRAWNRQMWSGNSNDWIVLPVGQDNTTSGCRQLRKSCEPWIYNRITGQSIRLASPTSEFWQPYDYYSGKIYTTTSVLPHSFSSDKGSYCLVIHNCPTGTMLQIHTVGRYSVRLLTLRGETVMHRSGKSPAVLPVSNQAVSHGIFMLYARINGKSFRRQVIVN